jgi:hypothetical protein
MTIIAQTLTFVKQDFMPPERESGAFLRPERALFTGILANRLAGSAAGSVTLMK